MTDRSRWTDFIVLVSARRNDGGWNVGTGFPVSTGKILTAYHTLTADAHRDNEVFVRWDSFRQPQCFADAVPDGDGFVRAEVAWVNARDDIAVLAAPHPLEASFLHLSTRKLNPARNFRSRGFPDGGKVRGDRAVLPMQGAIQPIALGEPTFSFSPVLPAATTGWGGLSGAPVVEDESHLVAGIVIEARTVFGAGSILQCVPSATVLMGAGFLDHISSGDGTAAELVAGSRICSEIAAGKNIRQLQQLHAHKGWFLKEADDLVNANMLAYDGLHLEVTKIGLNLITYIRDSDTMHFTYVAQG